MLHGDEAEPGGARDRIERDAPVGALLRDSRRDGVVIARLYGVPRRLGAAEQPIDQRARAAALIPVHHHA